MNIEKTCENCEYENEEQFGEHCRNCIHVCNATDNFVPKARYTERAKTVDAITERVVTECAENSFAVYIGGREVNVISIDGMTDIVMNVADEVKGDYSTSDLVDDLANAYAKAEKKGEK